MSNNLYEKEELKQSFLIFFTLVIQTRPLVVHLGTYQHILVVTFIRHIFSAWYGLLEHSV